MPEYYLVNPVINGTFDNKISGKNSLDAANKIYNTLSEYFNNDIPEFHFTLQEIKNNKTIIGGGKNSDYLHFKVNETKKDKKVNFRLVSVKVTNNGKQMKEFRNNIKKIQKQTGGKIKYDKDDDIIDDSDSDSEMYFPRYKSSKILSSPISYWWYDPYVFRIHKYYVPTFVHPVVPHISIPIYLP